MEFVVYLREPRRAAAGLVLKAKRMYGIAWTGRLAQLRPGFVVIAGAGVASQDME